MLTRKKMPTYLLTRTEARKKIDLHMGLTYVYALTDSDGKPFYIGKGVNGRVFQHFSSSKSNEANKAKTESIKEIGKDNVRFIMYGFTSDYRHALDVEEKLIKRHQNLTNVVHNDVEVVGDGMLTIAIGSGELEIFHKSRMGSIPDLVAIGNQHRSKHGKKLIIHRNTFISTTGAKSFIESLKRVNGMTDEEIMSVKKSPKTGKKETFACLEFLIYLAEKLDSDFHVMVINTFINDQILKLRDDGGNDFKKLNVAIDKLADRTRDLKPKGNKGCYMNIAKLLRAKIFSSTDIETYGNNSNIWNSPIATSDKQLLRTQYESKLVMLIDMGFVTTYPQLKDTILNKL